MGDTMREKRPTHSPTTRRPLSCNEPILRKGENRSEGLWPGLNQISMAKKLGSVCLSILVISPTNVYIILE